MTKRVLPVERLSDANSKMGDSSSPITFVTGCEYFFNRVAFVLGARRESEARLLHEARESDRGGEKDCERNEKRLWGDHNQKSGRGVVLKEWIKFAWQSAIYL